MIAATIWSIIAAPAAYAQSASENAVTSAVDAFGTSVGHDRIGVYSPRDVRGFSPTTAGNVRLDGLYFDQVARLNQRLQNSFAIRVGIAAQGYAFPAPTGIVDFTLRAPGNKSKLSSFSEIDTRGAASLEFDGATPLINDVLSIGGGVGFQRMVGANGFSAYQTNQGVLVKWNPAPNIQILPFWSRADFYDVHVQQAYTPSGSFLPQPNPGRHFFGPDWAHDRSIETTYGAIVEATFAGGWDLKAGLFRSAKSKPHGLFLEVKDLNPQGAGELNVYADPPSAWGSTSGEISLARSFTDGLLSHRVTLSFRMRDFNAHSGGSDVVDLGAVAIGQYIHVPKPDFQYSTQTIDHIGELTPGLSYQVSWKDVGIIGVGVQKPHYRKRSLVSGTAPIITKDEPWLFNMAVTGFILPSVTFYGDYTEGLEDNGLVPQNASNRGQALPAIATRQMDAGLSLHLIPGVNLLTGWFDIHKPYFNLNPSNLYTQLGEIHNKGLEFSMSGEVLPRLTLVAGVVFSEPQVTGDAVNKSFVGDKPVGIPSRKVNFNLNWRPPNTDSLILGTEISHQSHMASTLDNLVSIPEKTFVDADVRYSFVMAKHQATLRLWVQNIFDRRSLDVSSSGTYDIYGFSGRHVDLRLNVDF